MTAQEIGSNEKIIRDKVPGTIFFHIFKHLLPTAHYNISVQAISEAWTSGDLASEVFQFPISIREQQHEDFGAGGSFENDLHNPQNLNDLLVLKNIQAEELGQKISVSWHVSGNLNNVRAYQVKLKLFILFNNSFSSKKLFVLLKNNFF